MCKLSQLESIGVKFTELLQQIGIDDQQQLLATGITRNQRHELAKKTGINPKLIFKWITQADLARVHGIGDDYAELLEHCSVDSVQVLAQFNSEKLFQIMQRINEQTNLVKQMPNQTQVESWIAQAKILPIIVER